MTNAQKSEAALDAKIASVQTEVLEASYRELRAENKRDRERAIVLGKVGAELERRMGEEAFDALLDEIEAQQVAA